jgi:putative hydrolase of the HAD superfamily
LCRSKAFQKVTTLLKLVSFDVWNTLLSIGVFYRGISEELSRITGKEQVVLENRLHEGYQELKAFRRTGSFDESKIVPVTLKAISKVLKVDSEIMRKATMRTVMNISPREYVIDGAREAVEFAKNQSLKVAIVGNVLFWPGSYNRILLEKAGFSKLVEAQFYADEIGFSKPKSQIFDKVLSEFSVKPEEVLHVGDSLFEDFAGSILSHMHAVLVDSNVNGPIRLSSTRGHIIPSIKLLGNIINELVLGETAL